MNLKMFWERMGNFCELMKGVHVVKKYMPRRGAYATKGGGAGSGIGDTISNL